MTRTTKIDSELAQRLNKHINMELKAFLFLYECF